jgi:hypothetical protein
MRKSKFIKKLMKLSFVGGVTLNAGVFAIVAS